MLVFLKARSLRFAHSPASESPEEAIFILFLPWRSHSIAIDEASSNVGRWNGCRLGDRSSLESSVIV